MLILKKLRLLKSSSARITYIHLRGGRFCYLAIWQDKITRRIIGWSLSMEMTAQLIVSALQKAIGKGLVKAGAIIHSDRGSQYAYNGFRVIVEKKRFSPINVGQRQRFAITLSLSASFPDSRRSWSKMEFLKTWNKPVRIFSATSKAKTTLVRVHSSLGYKSPIEFEQELQTKKGGNERQFFV